MKKVIQPLAWYLVLTSVLALASGFALSVVTGTTLVHGASRQDALPPAGEAWTTNAALREGMARNQLG
ncbi:hypothetical protein D9M68_856750 [compost metagenome]